MVEGGCPRKRSPPARMRERTRGGGGSGGRGRKRRQTQWAAMMRETLLASPATSSGVPRQQRVPETSIPQQHGLVTSFFEPAAAPHGQSGGEDEPQEGGGEDELLFTPACPAFTNHLRPLAYRGADFDYRYYTNYPGSLIAEECFPERTSAARSSSHAKPPAGVGEEEPSQEIDADKEAETEDEEKQPGSPRVLHEVSLMNPEYNGLFINCEDGLQIPW